jgi:hypothetical protein
MNSEQARAHAERFFRKKEDGRVDNAKPRQAYEIAQHAMQEKTARLRALRLARDASNGDERK